MDQRRFDEWSRAVAQDGTRRMFLRGLAAIVAGAAGAAGLRSTAGVAASACRPFGSRCRRRRPEACCTGVCSDQGLCACPPDNPACDQSGPAPTAVVATFAVPTEPICPATCPPGTGCLNGACCRDDRVFVLCQSADICYVAESMRCCVGPDYGGPRRCCPEALVCGDVCCYDDQVCEEGICTGGVQYAGGVWLREP